MGKTVDKNKVSHRRIRRVSLDQFYALVTVEVDDSYQMCMVLPKIIEKVVDRGEGFNVPADTILDELRNIAYKIGEKSESLAMAMAVYMLGFNAYNGFKNYLKDEAILKRLYEYAKMLCK